MEVTDKKSALRRLQQLLDQRRQSLPGVVVDMRKWKRRREARRAKRRRLPQGTRPGLAGEREE